LKILATQYTLKYKSFDIYISGCNGNPHCLGCHNPETWSFDQGDQIDEKYMEKIKIKINDFNSIIENIMIFGGEPLDQNIEELEILLKFLNKYSKSIWIFTRYDLNEVPENIKKLCDYIKTGRYIKELSCEENIYYGINLSTSNQKIYKVR
jgi:anaerobic ribonucleoside-triphosphate reductase activating protein